VHHATHSFSQQQLFSITTDTIISKVWSFCTTLRDDGVSYGDYLEQLTYLIFLKMADEYGHPPYKRDVGVPKKYAWATLRPLKSAELEVHYVETLRKLSTEKGMLGQIFTKSKNKITDPAKLARLIEMVDDVQWVMLDSDVKGDIYEGILEKNAEDTKSGAGQYFTLSHQHPPHAQAQPLRLEDLREFITCYNSANRHKRKETWHTQKNPEGRWRKFGYDELVSRDKTSLDLFWLKDDSPADLDNLPELADLAEEIIDNIEAGLLSFRAVAAALLPATVAK